MVITQEVVQNEQENVTTDPDVSDDIARLKERVKILEENIKFLHKKYNIK